MEQELKRIADALEKMTEVYANPEAFMDRVALSAQDILARAQITLPQPAPPVQVVEGGAPRLPQVTGVEVRLSDEERKALCEMAMTDIEAQMDEFRGFISQALSELPEATLKKIGQHLAKGEKFKLRRRHGCIYLDFGYGDEDFYLKM